MKNFGKKIGMKNHCCHKNGKIRSCGKILQKFNYFEIFNYNRKLLNRVYYLRDILRGIIDLVAPSSPYILFYI